MIAPIVLEIRLKARRLAQSAKEKPIVVFFTIRFRQGWNKVLNKTETEKK